MSERSDTDGSRAGSSSGVEDGAQERGSENADSESLEQTDITTTAKSGGGTDSVQTDGEGAATPPEPGSVGGGGGRTGKIAEDVATELSRTDVMILQSIRDINENPDDYPDEHTRDGGVAATTTAVREATGYSKDQVRYRFQEGERGLETMGEGGILNQYESRMTRRGPGPRSAELTEFGELVLETALGNRATDERNVSADSEAGEELQERVSDLEATLAEITEREFGGLSDERAEQLEGVIGSMLLFYDIFDAIGINAQDMEPGQLSGAEKEQLRDAVAETLAGTDALSE